MDRPVIILFVIITMLGISHNMYAYSLTLFAYDEIGADFDELGHIGSSRFLPYLFIPLFIGILLDRVIPRYLLLMGVVIYSVPVLLISFSATVFEIIMFQVAIGSSHAFIWPPAQSILSQNARRRRKYVGLFVMFFIVGLALGALFASIILGMVEDDYRLILQIAGGMMLISIAFIAFLHPRKRRIPKSDALDIASFKKILHFPLTLSVVVFSTALVAIIFTIYPSYVHDHGIEPSHILLLFTVYSISRIGAMSIVHRLHNYLDKMLILCMALMSIGMAITIFATTFVDFIFALILLGVGISLIYPLGLDEILTRIERRLANKMIGAYECMVGLGWALGPMIGGYAAHLGSVNREPGEPIATPYWLFLIIGVIITTILTIFHKRMDVRKYIISREDGQSPK